MSDLHPTAALVLVEVTRLPDAVTFTSRLLSGCLTRQTIQRPAYRSPGQDLDNPDALPF